MVLTDKKESAEGLHRRWSSIIIIIQTRIEAGILDNSAK